MLLAGIQAKFGLDPRLKHSGVTVLGVASLDPSGIFAETLSTVGARHAVPLHLFLPASSVPPR
jgi:hypothetical protein